MVRIQHSVAVMLLLAATWGMTLQSAHAASPLIYANGVLAYTNAERYKAGLPLLNSNVTLSSVAKTKMQDLFARQYFAHESPSGKTVSDLVDDVGYTYIAVGENLALGDFGSSKGVVDAWMDSPGHRANILSPTYTEIGIAAGRSMYKGRNTWIIVQSFGLPRSSCPALDTSLREDISQQERTLDILKTIAEMREAAIADRHVSATVYRQRVDAYNLAAKLYNERAAAYRTLIAEYNDEVGTLNSCIETKTAHLAAH